MNLIILKYGILIGALLTTTAFVSGTFNNTSAVQGEQNSSGINTQSVFAFGSQVFYKARFSARKRVYARQCAGVFPGSGPK